MKTIHKERPEAKALGAAIRKRRESTGLSQERLGGRVGVSKEQIRRIESGENFPSFGLYFAICDELERSPSTFMRSADKLRRDLSGVAQSAARLTVNQQLNWVGAAA